MVAKVRQPSYLLLMLIPKPRHLQTDYAQQFADASVVAAYAARPPYPQSVFEHLRELALSNGRALELGAGTGDVTFGLAERLSGVDAVEPAQAMVEAARLRTQEERHASSVRWYTQTAESFEPERQYALVVAGESLHKMEWEQVMPMIASALAPGAVLAIIADRVLEGLPWQAELGQLIAEYSTNRDYRPYDIAHELSLRGLFRELDRKDQYDNDVRQPLAAYVLSFHSRNGFSRERMQPTRAAAFDAAVESLVRSHVVDGCVSGTVRSTLIWGVPVTT